jgi:hypothetical protein
MVKDNTGHLTDVILSKRVLLSVQEHFLPVARLPVRYLD